jgi:formate/nitrite transporter
MKSAVLASMLITGVGAFNVAPSVTSPIRVRSIARMQPRQSAITDATHDFFDHLPEVLHIESFKSAKDAYLAFAEKGVSNARMSKRKILHQSILGGCYVGFGGLLSLSIAGNMGGVAAVSPGLTKMMFAALFPVNLLFILTTGGQLFTGNSASVAAAKFEGNVEWRELFKSWTVSLIGNVIGCSMFALAAYYSGLLVGGTAELCTSTAIAKCSAGIGQTLGKAVFCNWMVSLAVFLAGASNDLAGKMIGIWFPISTFVAIGLEHSVANMFIMAAAMLLKAPLSLGTILVRNMIPAIIGNAIAGVFVVAGSYSYQFGKLGGNDIHESIEKKRQEAIAAKKVQANNVAML